MGTTPDTGGNLVLGQRVNEVKKGVVTSRPSFLLDGIPLRWFSGQFDLMYSRQAALELFEAQFGTQCDESMVKKGTCSVQREQSSKDLED